MTKIIEKNLNRVEIGSLEKSYVFNIRNFLRKLKKSYIC